MSIQRIALITLITLAMALQAFGQCQSFISDRAFCPGETLTVNPCCFMGGIGPYTYTWSASSGIQFLSGQNSPTVQIRVNFGNPAFLFCSRYDAGANCTVTQETDYWPTADTYYSIYNGVMACPSANNIDTVVIGWARYPTGSTECHDVTWSAIGGTILGQNRTYNGPMSWIDSIRVQWSGAPLQQFQATARTRHNMWGTYDCYYTTNFISTGGTTSISGPTSGCDTTINRTYTAPFQSNFNYVWTATNGSIISGQGTSSVVVRWHGSGTLNLSQTSTVCTSVVFTATRNFSFTPMTPVNLGPDQNTCSNVTLNAGFYNSYLWSTGATTSTLTVTQSGTYHVRVTNSSGCQSRDTVVVTINPPPSPSLGPNQSHCPGFTPTLNPGNFAAYAWSTGATAPTISPLSSGTYSVTVTDANACTGSTSVTVTFHSPPTPNLGPDQNLCTGATATLNPGTFASYAWSTGTTSPAISPAVTGTYSVTVTDTNGCTGSDTMNLTVLPLPTFSLGADSFVCADTFATLDGPAGMSSYNWSNSATTPSIVVNSSGNYTLTVTDANGCTASDDQVITALTDCVFPGDANYDGVADNLDVLSIGAYNGFAGGTRPGASLQWYGQSLPDWGGALPGNADPKHSDCDGNGTVAAVDTQAVTLNYGLTHSKGAGITGGPVQLMVRALADSVFPGDPAWFVVEMGDAQNVADSAYGIAMRLSPSGIPLASPGIFTVDYTNCWFAAGPDRVDFTQPLGANGPVDVAVVRNDQNEQSGFGEVFRFAVATDANLVPVRDSLHIALSNVVFVDANLTLMTLTVTNGSIVVSHLVTGTTASAIPQPVVYPNPTNGFVRISQIGANALEVIAVDALGKMVKTMRTETGNSLLMDTHDLPAGIYLLRIKTELGTYLKRLVVE